MALVFVSELFNVEILYSEEHTVFCLFWIAALQFGSLIFTLKAID